MAWIKKGKETTIQEVFMRNIGVTSLQEINEWVIKHRKFGYRIDRLKEAAQLALQFKNKPVRIFGDYDADGVTSTSILDLALTWAGFSNVTYRIPKRFTEGFGINKIMVDEFENETSGPGLIITCDNGVAQSDVINYAKSKGFTVIIIDHHQPVVKAGKSILPEADIIIDPHAIPGSADFNGYCGAGLSYRFACELLSGDGVKDGLSPEWEKILRGLAAVGTVADVMEIREENYFIVRYGLQVLHSALFTTTGTYALISALGLSANITAHDIGFKIGPTINACSRMKDDGAKDAVEMLLFRGYYEEAVTMAEHLIEVNKVRKKAKKEALIKADEVIAEQCMYSDCPLVLNLPDTPEGIIGIVAGALCEKFKVPTIVTTNTEEGILKGSGRSCGNFNMKEKLDTCGDLFLRYGGHAEAAGLSLRPENLDKLREALTEVAEDFEFEDMGDSLYDLEIDAKEITATINELVKYEPYGNGNAPIVFKIKNFSVIPKNGSYVTLIGDDNSIVKLFSKNVTAIGFDVIEKFKNISNPVNCDLIGTLSYNYFGGDREPQIEFSDIEIHQTETVETPLAARLALMSKF